MPVLLAPLIIVADLLVELAVAALATYIIIGLFKLAESVLGGVPVVGPFLRSSARSVAQELTNLLGGLERGIDSAIGSSWHLLAESADWVWRETKHQAGAILQASILVSALAAAYQLLHRELRDATNGLSHSGVRLKTLEREFHGIDKQLRTLERDLGGIEGAHVGARLKALEREFHGIDDVTIPYIRSIANSAETTAADALTAVRSIPFPTSAKTWADAIALALPTLGINWIRCGPLGNLFNSRGCGVGSILEDLLGGLFDVFLLADFCQLLPEAEALFADLADPAIGLISSAANAVCAQKPGNYPQLGVPALALPTAAEVTGTL